MLEILRKEKVVKIHMHFNTKMFTSKNPGGHHSPSVSGAQGVGKAAGFFNILFSLHILIVSNIK